MKELIKKSLIDMYKFICDAFLFVLVFSGICIAFFAYVFLAVFFIGLFSSIILKGIVLAFFVAILLFCIFFIQNVIENKDEYCEDEYDDYGSLDELDEEMKKK